MSEVEGEVVAGAEMVEDKPRAETRKLEQGAEAPKARSRRAETKVLEPEAETALAVPEAIPHLGLTREEMNWAAIAHASVLVTVLLGVLTSGFAALLGPILPALIWYAHRDKSEYVVEQARQATVFQVAGIVALLALAIAGGIVVAVGWAVSAVLVLILIGLLLLLVMVVVTVAWGAALVALPVAQVVYGCYAAVETYSGRPFRYRWIADLIDRYQAQS